MKLLCAKTTVKAALAAAALVLGTAGIVQAEEAGNDSQQFARGAEAWQNNCARCHNMRDTKELQDYEWEVSVMHMRKVANLPGMTARDIMVFLKAAN
ncbi:c-type cytochrome [Thiohalophilus thiocyanatoxydans]|uniref:Cytochrome c n=1 Tax=Thiohalophilus thiocyanatoxydans TaxID=381308 RepID=A0A4R8ITU5_9GAMM|nr:c-type cytochrome [Thiohalophilus thiocyanatoxydans]TDY02850.1 cytochrome c [Thiohalophilus thiocyanatoxydans]